MVLVLALALASTGLAGCGEGDGGGGDGEEGLRLPNISFSSGGLAVRGVYAAEPTAGDRAALYLSVTNETGSTDELLSVSSPAGRAEIHQSVEESGRVMMTRVEKITIPSGWTVHLEPGSYHIMLRDLEWPVQTGDRIPATLEFRSGRMIEVTAEVRPYAELEELLSQPQGQ